MAQPILEVAEQQTKQWQLWGLLYNFTIPSNVFNENWNLIFNVIRSHEEKQLIFWMLFTQKNLIWFCFRWNLHRLMRNKRKHIKINIHFEFSVFFTSFFISQNDYTVHQRNQIELFVHHKSTTVINSVNLTLDQNSRTANILPQLIVITSASSLYPVSNVDSASGAFGQNETNLIPRSVRILLCIRIVPLSLPSSQGRSRSSPEIEALSRATSLCAMGAELRSAERCTTTESHHFSHMRENCSV